MTTSNSWDTKSVLMLLKTVGKAAVGTRHVRQWTFSINDAERKYQMLTNFMQAARGRLYELNLQLPENPYW